MPNAFFCSARDFIKKHRFIHGLFQLLVIISIIGSPIAFYYIGKALKTRRTKAYELAKRMKEGFSLSLNVGGTTVEDGELKYGGGFLHLTSRSPDKLGGAGKV